MCIYTCNISWVQILEYSPHKLTWNPAVYGPIKVSVLHKKAPPGSMLYLGGGGFGVLRSEGSRDS